MIYMTREDINRTYGDTYIGYRVGNVIQPLRVLESSEEEDNCFFGILGNNEGSDLYDLNDTDIVLTFPDSGAFNVGREAVHISRHAQRQWHRGIRDRVVRITSPTRSSLTSAMVRSMFNPTYCTKAEAILAIQGGECVGRAVNRNFWITKHPRFKYPVIYFRSCIVGEYKNESFQIESPLIKSLFEESMQ